MMENCEGCKWIDRVSKGAGYCCHVKSYGVDPEQLKKYEHPGVRSADMERCRAYEKGDFATRHHGGNNGKESTDN